MAIVIESIDSDYAADTSDATISLLPSGISDGDLLIAIVSKAYSRDITPPSGWTTIADNTTDYFAAFYKVASSESGSYDFTHTGTYGYTHGIMLRLSGADTPDANEYAYDETWGSTTTCEDVSTTDNDSLVLWCVSHVSVASSTTVSSSDRGSEQYDSVGNSASQSLAVYSEPVASAGSQSGAVFTMSAAGNKYAHLSLSIPPSVTPSSSTTVNCTLGQISIAGQDASVSVGVDVDATLGQVAIAGQAASVSAGTDVNCAAGAVTVAGLAASVSAGTTVNCSVGTVTISGKTAGISSGVTFTCTTGAVVVAGNAATVSPTVQVNCGVGALVIAALDAAVTSTTLVSCGVGTVVIAGKAASVDTGEIDATWDTSGFKRTWKAGAQGRTWVGRTSGRTFK